jgi:uncharacterized membrane protein
MLKLNSELRAEARASLTGKWGMTAVISLVYYLLSVAGSLIIPFYVLLVGFVLGYGFVVIFLLSVRGKQPEVGDLFDGFRNYGSVLGTMLLTAVYTFLWSLLLVIPGLIKTYSYAMTPYLLRDNPTLGADALICKSMEMMNGHKMKLFLLDLSFIGWLLLGVLSFGIGLLWVIPYMYSARAAFYEDLLTLNKGNNSVVEEG